MNKKNILTFIFMIMTIFQGYGQENCPTKNQVKTSLRGLITQEFNIKYISQFQDIKELCEVVIKIGVQPMIFYIDKQSQHLIIGNVIELNNKKNLTKDKQQELMKLPANYLNEFEKHVNVKYGIGEKYIYFITDPDCPFSKKSNQIVEEWANERNIQIRLLFFPFPKHKEAFVKSVSVICDKKGFKEYIEGYQSENQCKEGRKAVESNLNFLRKLGINSTPTFIGMNGRLHIGIPTEEDLNKLVD